MEKKGNFDISFIDFLYLENNSKRSGTYNTFRHVANSLKQCENQRNRSEQFSHSNIGEH